MKILVTGANGMLARAVIRHCAEIGDEVIGLTRRELDISDASLVDEALQAHRPDAVLNCAAYTNVDGAEAEKDAAFAANAFGVENLAISSCDLGCRFLTISTDYVFDGENSGFYTQRDTPSPISEYGLSKLEGERLALAAYGRAIVVRSGWIYGEHGTNFLSVMHKLLAEGKTIKAIGDAYGTPTSAGDLARRMRELVELDLPCIYHVTNSGEGTSYLGFAEAVCEIGGFDKSLLEPVSKDDLKRPAPRPASSKLTCLFSEKFGLEPLPDWRLALERFLQTETRA
jgi:dTDP-4-dehydrorhamnose reductase